MNQPDPRDQAERRLPGLPPPPVTEEEEPARRFPGLPPPPVPKEEMPAIPAPTGPDSRSNSARLALDDLEAKGLFLVRPSKPGPSPQAPVAPLSGTPGRGSDWNLFIGTSAEAGPLGSLPGLPAKADPSPLAADPTLDRTGKPPEYRAADLLVDEMAGNVRHERFQDFIRRFERPVEAHRRALEDLYPPGVVNLFDRKAWQALIEGFQRVIPSAPEEPAAWMGLALCALAQKDLKTASALADHALGLDETLALDRLLAEVRPTAPRNWLRLAEALGRLGHLEPAMDICNRVASDLETPDPVRRRAQKTRSKVRHDYFRNRGEADPETGRERSSPIRALRVLGTVLAVLACLGLAFAGFVKARTAFYLERGETRLAMALNLAEKLERREPVPDHRVSIEEHVAAAMTDFSEARRWNDAHVRATFLNAAAADLLLEIGRLRRASDRRWDSRGWAEARQTRDRAHAELERLDLDPTRRAAEEKALGDLKKRASRGVDLGF